MPNQLVQAGAVQDPTSFAPLHTSRIFTGIWTNRSFLRDAATNYYQERFGLGRQDSILDGYNSEITPRLTLARRPGSTIFNAGPFPPVNRFYSFNVFSQTDEAIHVLADTADSVWDVTPTSTGQLFTKSPGAGSTYFQSVGNNLYFSNGVDNMQWDHDSGFIGPWGLNAPASAPSLIQQTRPNNYPSWQPGTAYMVSSPALKGMVILDDLTDVPSGINLIPTQNGGHVAVMCGQNFASGTQIALGGGFDASRLLVWCTAGVGLDTGQTTPGVFQAQGVGGIINASFQNRSGGFGFTATGNWIAIAWDAASGITPYTSGNYSGISFRTSMGDELWLQIGFGAHQTDIYMPPGTSLANSLHMPGMMSCDNVDHAMHGVLHCRLDGSTIYNFYDDESANLWHGNTAVFSVFWNSGEHPYTTGVTNGTALIIPITGANSVAMIFSVLNNDQAHGLPAGYNASQFTETCAMNGHQSGGSNRGHGWTCLMKGQTFTGWIQDGEGHQWFATGNAFAVGSATNASGGNVQFANGTGTTGGSAPAWNQTVGGTTSDGSVTWTNLGSSQWQPNHYYAAGSVVMGVVTSVPGTPNQLYVAIQPGTSSGIEPHWLAGVNTQLQDNEIVWQCLGRALSWQDIGASTQISAAGTIVDPNGYLQNVYSSGVSGTIEPNWMIDLGAVEPDNTMQWQNAGPFAPQGQAPIQYGYSYVNPGNTDQSNMSPATSAITVMVGNQVVLQGQGTGQPGVGEIWIWRTLQGGAIFYFLTSIPNPGAGNVWTFTDNLPDSELNLLLQAPNAGQNTPLPVGATCLAYHLSRVWAAVGNVVWVSSGPDAFISGSNGNVGFNTSFTLQSKVTRLWPCPLGMMVFTVRDCYLIQGTATANDPLYAVVFIEGLPLLSYDAFSVNKTTPYLLLGNRMFVALDPSAGINEIGFPIADRLRDEFDASKSYVTYHRGTSVDTAVYVANGIDHWYRMGMTSAPESGVSWSPRGVIQGGVGCVQSVEVRPGIYCLLMSGTTPGPILQRDYTHTAHTDNGVPYPVMTRFGSIVLAVPGQLAALSFITLESLLYGSRAQLALLLGERDGTFEELRRTRQDPTNLPPSDSIYADRYHFMQNQQTAWCRHFQMEVSWPAEDAANELLTFTIFGQTWEETRMQ